MDLVLDAVQARHHHGSKRQVGVGGGIREAYFDAATLGAGYPGNPDGSGAVAGRVGQHYRCFEAGYQALVAVGGGVGEGVQGTGVLDDAADVVQSSFRQAAVLVAGEDVFAVFGQGLVYVHAGAVVTYQRLGHEGNGLAVGVAHVLDDVLHDLVLVGALHQGIEHGADFALAGGSHFVVMHLYGYTHIFQCQAHGGTQVVQGIDRRYGEVAAFQTGTVTDVAVFINTLGVPLGFFGIDLVERAGHIRAPAHVVEDEELGLGAEIGSVSDAGGFQIGFRTLGDRAGITLVTFHCGGLEDVTADVDHGFIGEGVDDRRVRVRHEDHVRFIDTFPAGDGRAVEHLAFGEHVFIDLADGQGNMLFLAAGIGKA